MIHEGLLQGMQLRPLRQTLDGTDLRAFGLHGKHEAGAYRITIDDHGAGTTDTMLATHMGTGETALLTDHIGQGASRLHLDLMSMTVDRQCDGVLHGQ